MKSDATRDTFDATKQLSRVIVQQGRVALDADHNEQVAIFWHYLTALAADVIGPHGAPAKSGGFDLAIDGKQLIIGAGRYYVDGLLIENPADLAYDQQPGYPLPGDPLGALDPNAGDATFFVYLDVWEHHVTAIEDSSIREVALGGPDTCTRAKVVWQVRSAVLGGGPGAARDCQVELERLLPLGGAKLAAQLDPGAISDDPCVMAPESRYRGLENQLYRVEIHRSSTDGAPTFKWSRDNGSVLTAVDAIAGNELRVASTRGFEAGDWVELTDDDLDLRGEPGVLLRLAKIEGGTLSLEPDATPPLPAASVHPKVRRWNQRSSEDIVLADGAVPVAEANDGKDAWIDLEDGVQVQFLGGLYRSGDYWQIPARVATGRIEWPTTLGAGGVAVADALPPRGIRHHYAPLGFVDWKDRGLVLSDPTCRRTFSPLAAGPNL
jgi:hypothetical protein